MKDKLTLSIDKEIIEFAHRLSDETDQSISSMVEQYFIELQEIKDKDYQLSPRVKNLMGYFEGEEIMRAMGDFEEFVSERAKKEGMVELVENILLNKFESLPAEYRERLKEQDKDKLNVIAVKIMEIENLKELEDYLN
ncbi:DUF6364 family protein [Fuchsiella alkaliacetigena]|uniref:DUF6364 family protein n=1 Tax=Fuchsiella alkaliacetigena TaxID=957042 RepID=UPI00200B900B|nr:DUF6364 family protein [Fuchsiella alkaliacetigena]MCK8825879.1 DUF6364 family protein [Fuchsiella alkaliacetigena]